MKRKSHLRVSGLALTWRAGLVTAVLALTSALPSYATASDSQLALSLGITPGDYTTSELILLKRAASEDDGSFGRLLRQLKERPEASGSHVLANEALVRAAGLEPGRYTAAELAVILNAQQNNEGTTLRHVSARGLYGLPRDDRGEISGTKAQLAASLGVDPLAYTTDELARLRLKAEEDDD